MEDRTIQKKYKLQRQALQWPLSCPVQFLSCSLVRHNTQQKSTAQHAHGTNTRKHTQTRKPTERGNKKGVQKQGERGAEEERLDWTHL